MLDPDTVLNSIVASLQSIPELVAELGGPAIPATESITGHYFYSGAENAEIQALGQMKSPSMMVAYLDQTLGNFDAQTVWKHRLNLYIRARNKASNGGASSAPHIWWMALNLPISVPQVAPNIRSIDLVNGLLWLFEANVKHQQDELSQDFFIGTLVFNEIGDAGPDGVNQLCVGPATQLSGQDFSDLAQIIASVPRNERQRLFEKVNELEEASYGR